MKWITQIQTIILKVQRLNKCRKFELQIGLIIWCLVGTNDQDGFLEVFVLLRHFKPWRWDDNIIAKNLSQIPSKAVSHPRRGDVSCKLLQKQENSEEVYVV